MRCLSIRTTALLIAGLGLFRPPGSAAPSLNPPTVVFIAGEEEYKSAETLPKFQADLERAGAIRGVFLHKGQGQEIAGLDALERADLAVLFVRRLTLPDDQLGRIRTYLGAGRPLVALRTASHAFENWKQFDREVLGGNYGNHHDAKLAATARIVEAAGAHPILRGVPASFPTGGSLYRNSPLPAGSVPLLTGEVAGHPAEPVAWTRVHRGGRVFYTSLGHPRDFEAPAFRQLLVNALFWALDRPVPEGAATVATADPGLATAAEVAPGPPQRIEVDAFERLWRDRKLTVLDVRTPAEFARGHIPGAININFLAPDFARKVAELDPNRAYLVHCASGGRSASACAKMAGLDFKRLYDLAPGFRGWEAAGKPVEKSAASGEK